MAADRRRRFDSRSSMRSIRSTRCERVADEFTSANGSARRSRGRSWSPPGSCAACRSIRHGTPYTLDPATGEIGVARESPLWPLPTEPAAAPELNERSAAGAADERVARHLRDDARHGGRQLSERLHPSAAAAACRWCGRRRTARPADAPVKPYDNIPIASYLWLRGRCRSCRAPISIKYPIVELVDRRRVSRRVSAVRFARVLIQRLLFACAMIVLFVIDLEHRILPDVITLPGIVHRVSCSASSCRPAGWTRSSASSSAAARCG